MGKRAAAVRLSARQNARLRERLDALCEREGVTKRELATRAGISVGAVRTIGKTEAGPTLGTLLALTKALRLKSIDELLGPSPTVLLRAHDQLESQVGRSAMQSVMLTDQNL